MNSVRFNNQSLKYQRYTPSGCKHIKWSPENSEKTQVMYLTRAKSMGHSICAVYTDPFHLISDLISVYVKLFAL